MPKVFNPNLFNTADEILNEVQIDTYDDYGVMRKRLSHWLFRVWKKINRQLLRPSRKIILPVSDTTHTVELPPDFLDYNFIGIIDECSNLIPLAFNPNLAPAKGIEDGRVLCDKCQSTEESLCKSLGVEVVTQTVTIAGNDYTRTVTKLLNDNGQFIEETVEPVAYYENGVVTSVNMITSNRIVCQLEVKPCGCIDPSATNVQKLCSCGSQRALFFDVAHAMQCKCCGHAQVLCTCSTRNLRYEVNSGLVGSYNIYKEEGFIQLSPDACVNSLYVDFMSCALSRGNIYYFPEISFECLISGTYYRSIEKKPNVPYYEKERARREYMGEKKEVLRDLTRTSMDMIVDAFNRAPRIPAI